MPVKRGILLMYQHNKIFEKTVRKDNLLTSCALHYASNDICGKELSEKTRILSGFKQATVNPEQ